VDKDCLLSFIRLWSLLFVTYSMRLFVAVHVMMFADFLFAFCKEVDIVFPRPANAETDRPRQKTLEAHIQAAVGFSFLYLLLASRVY